MYKYEKQYKIYIIGKDKKKELFKDKVQEGDLDRFLMHLNEWQRKSIIIEEIRERNTTPEEVQLMLNEEQWYK